MPFEAALVTTLIDAAPSSSSEASMSPIGDEHTMQQEQVGLVLADKAQASEYHGLDVCLVWPSGRGFILPRVYGCISRGSHRYTEMRMSV
jgi:hypothetical protein